MAEFSRVINKNGKIILTFSNLWSPRGFIYLFRKLLKTQSHPLNRYSILSLKKYAEINGLIIRDIRGLDYLPLRTGGVMGGYVQENKKNKVILALFDHIEKKIRKSLLKYFGNEIMLLLVKKLDEL